MQHHVIWFFDSWHNFRYAVLAGRRHNGVAGLARHGAVNVA